MPHSPRILVAEDDSGIREIIRIRLRSVGYEVEVARDGLEALHRVRGWRPEAMVLDINMPNLDGFGVLTALGGERLLPRTLILTARHAADDVNRAIGLGAKDYLSKPFTEGQLIARVARLVRKAAATPPSDIALLL
jgi:two-component system OmpR family response regulator